MKTIELQSGFVRMFKIDVVSTGPIGCLQSTRCLDRIVHHTLQQDGSRSMGYETVALQQSYVEAYMYSKRPSNIYFVTTDVSTWPLITSNTVQTKIQTICRATTLRLPQPLHHTAREQRFMVGPILPSSLYVRGMIVR